MSMLIQLNSILCITCECIFYIFISLYVYMSYVIFIGLCTLCYPKIYLFDWLIDWLIICFFKFKFSSYNNSKMSCRFYRMYLIFSSNFEFSFDILVFILLLKRMPSVFVLLHLKPFCFCSAKKGGSFKSLFRVLLILSTEFYIRYMYH